MNSLFHDFFSRHLSSIYCLRYLGKEIEIGLFNVEKVDREIKTAIEIREEGRGKEENK